MATEADIAEKRVSNQSASIRAAKKEARPQKIGLLGTGKPNGVPKNGGSKAGKGVKGGKKSAFDEKSGGKHEGMRAKQVKVNLSKKGKVGGKGKGGKAGKGGGKKR